MATLRFRNLPPILPGKLDVFMADPRLIVVDGDYNCRDMKSAETLAHIDWLAEEIGANGFNPEMPLTVKRRDDDLVVVRGHCRLAACNKLIEQGVELSKIPVMQLGSGMSDVDLIFDQESSNYGLRLDEMAKGRLCLKARRLGIEDDEIARRMHWKSAASVQQHIKMVELIPEPVKQQIRDGAISATEATRLVKSLPKGTDPVEAAKIIAAAQEENKRIVGSKKNRSTKVTRKTLERGKAKAQHDAANETDRAIFDEQHHGTEDASRKPDAPLPSALAATSNSEPQTFSPLSDETPPHHETHEQLQTAIAKENGSRTFSADKHGVNEEPSQVTTRPPPPPSSFATGREFPAVAFEKPRDGIEGLLLKFLNADALALATMHTQLTKEHQEAAAQDGATDAQYQLCVAADVIGALRFPDEWESAKASSEMAAVA